WDANTGQCLQILDEHDGYRVSGVSYSPNGDYFLSFADSRFIKIWDANTYSVVKTLGTVGMRFTSANWSPDGRYIISTAGDQTLKIWGMQ
ncbi:MAG: hypothetical protein UH543_08500, partial [Bacteroidales bacterium]|nr:hypothetical protein [Bacteroidales bacterium]